MGNKYGIIENGVIVNICIGQPDNCDWVHLTGDLAYANIGDKIQDGQFVRPEPTALELWQEKVRANQAKIELAMKQANYINLFMRTDSYISYIERNRRASLKSNSEIKCKKLHAEYEKLKREAPDGWTIDKEGYAVQK